MRQMPGRKLDCIEQYDNLKDREPSTLRASGRPGLCMGLHFSRHEPVSKRNRKGTKWGERMGPCPRGEQRPGLYTCVAVQMLFPVEHKSGSGLHNVLHLQTADRQGLHRAG
jgi:hypothetical protein